MKLLAVFVIIFLFTSCEGIIQLSGKLVSEDTGKEIENARIELLDVPPILHFDSTTNTFKDSIFTSNEKGLFSVHSRMVGMIFGPPKFRIRITKDGYETEEILFNRRTSKELFDARDSLYIIKLKQE